MAAMRVIFMGSPAFAVPSLRALHAAGHDIVAVYTQPPRPKGRGMQVLPTDVQLAAEELGLGDRVRCPDKLRGAALEEILATGCDVVCVVAYGLLLPEPLVKGKICVNVHPSALPRWRGAAPLQWTLLAGDTHSEVCLMQLDTGMDTGDVYERIPLAVGPNDTYGTLHDRAAALGAEGLVALVERIDVMQAIPQGETGATHARKITKDDRMLDLTLSAREVHNKIRALSPAPCATLDWKDETVKVRGSRLDDSAGGVAVACGEGSVWIAEAQRAGDGWKAAGDILL